MKLNIFILRPENRRETQWCMCVFQVLLEVLTGRRALEKDGMCGERYLVIAHTCSHSRFADQVVLNLKLWKMAEFFQTRLVCFLASNLVCLSRTHPGFDSGLQKDLVEDIKEGPGGSTEAVWRKHLDKRLISGQCWS